MGIAKNQLIKLDFESDSKWTDEGIEFETFKYKNIECDYNGEILEAIEIYPESSMDDPITVKGVSTILQMEKLISLIYGEE